MDRLNSALRRLPNWAVYLGGVVPFLWLAGNVVESGLGPDPVKAVEHRLGELGLQFLTRVFAPPQRVQVRAVNDQ